MHCETKLLTADAVWAVDERNEGRRQHVWRQLGKLVQGLPRRNLLVLGADANASCRYSAGFVGRGVLDNNARNTSEDFMQLIQVNQLVLLNTWGLSRSSASHTFSDETHINLRLISLSLVDLLQTSNPGQPLRYTLPSHHGGLGRNTDLL